MVSFRYFPLAVAASLLAIPAMADNLEFLLENNSSFSIVELYASPSNIEQWEEDILGQDILEAGDSARVTIGDGRRTCEYDLKIVFEDGDEITNTADLCKMESYRVDD